MSLLQDEYKLAIDNKMLSSEVSEQDFANILKDDNMRKAYWDYCHKKDPSFYAEDYNRFSQLTAEMLNTSTPSVAAHPAPTTAQEDDINMQNQKEGAAQYNVVTPVVSSPTQTMDYNAMTLDELQQVRNEQLRKAQANKERRIGEQKIWEQEHPFLASVAAMRGGGAYTDKSAGETLKEVDADQFAEDSKEQNAVKEALGRKLYESNYNNIGGEVERMQSVVANISREDKKLGERKDLDKAEYVLDQAHKLATAPSKYDPSTNGFVNFGKGIADNTNRDLIPAVELIRDVNINNAIKKMNDGKELTEGERALILSYITYSDVQQARQYDLPMGYQAGAAAAESIPFMAEMLLTKGASKLAVSQVIRIMKAAGKTADQINDFAKWMNLGAKGIKVDDVVYGAVEEGAKRTVGGVARNTASELVGTTLQTAAMPSTYQGMVEDNMRTRLATGENDIEGYNMNNLRNFGNAWVQTLTERKGGELIDWGLGKIMPFDKIWHTKAGNQMVANQFFQSPVAETMEEYLAAVINYGRSFNPLYNEESNERLKQEAEEMFTAEGLGKTFLSMLPNTILGGAVNLYDVHKTSNDYNNARSKVLGELVKSGATQEQAENILMQIETSNEEEMQEKFGTLYAHFNIESQGGAGAKAAEEYIKAAQAYQFSVADLANKFANLTPEEQAQAQQEMQAFTSQVRQKAVEHEARITAQTQAGEASNEDGYVYQVTRADGTTPEGSRMYISAGNVVTTDNGKGQQIIDRTQSSKDVFVTTYDADGNANVEHVALDELDLLFAPTSRQQVEDELYTMFMQEYAMAQQMAQQMAEQQAAQEQGQQVAGEDNVQPPLGAEGEQASNIEGRQFTNGQQTITASNPDSNGNVTLSAPITLPNGEVSERVMPQQVFNDLMSGLVREEGWQEVNSQPTAQGQAQGQQVAPQPVVWSEMDAEQATATVVERSKGDKERAKKFAQKQVEVKTKALQEAQAEMDAFEGEDLDAFNAAQDKVDAAQAEVDKWTAVVNGIDAYNAPVQPRQSTQNQQQSANNSQNTLQNGNNSVPLQEKKRKRAQEIIDKIQGGNNTVYLFDMNDIIKVLEDAGVSQISVGNVKKQIAQMREGDVIGGFQIGNKIFINYDQDENEIRRKYVHERQHILTTAQLANKMASSMSWNELFDVVCNLCGSRAYQDRNAIDLANELISFSMEWVYEYDNNQIVRGVLKKYGLNEEQILTLINLGNEQRKDNTLSRARRTAYVNNSRQESRRQDGRDISEITTRDMEGQGVRPSITSESGTPSARGEVTQDTALEESGIQVNDETGDARFSVNYRLDAKQMDILTEKIAERVGVSKAKAKKWLKAETSLAALCLQEDNVAALYYFADGRYGAIKDNSDYPQGTVDFNNICRKRLDFTNIYLSLQREFPNKVFTAKDLETIRQIMMEDGLEVACGLCYVEDRRQLLGEIANEFRGFLKDRVIPEDLSATKKEVMQKVLDMVGDDAYIPTIAQLLEAGAYELRNSHPNIFEAFVVFNNSRGMQSGRLFEGYAEYKREILDWSDKKVKQVNDAGGLRIFSFSDFEAHHLIDIVQIINDAASKGVMIQGYTKVPEFARAVRKTRIKLNRSLIPLGDTGIQEVNGKKVLAYDTTEGIDVNSENFLDESSSPNVGNVLVGINDEQIRMAMEDANVDYIIPFHTGLKKDILLQKKIGAWVNYKNYQTEKDAATGSSKTADGKKVVGVNIYTDVLQAAEKEGRPIKNRKEFVEYFLKVCKERGLVPRFEQFLARGKNGEYKYTKGYEKLLVDFKMFDKRGNILPQEPVVPIFDDAFNQQIIEDYVKGTKETKEYESTKERCRKGLNLVKFSIGDNSNTDYLNSKQKKDGRDIVGDVRFSVTRSRRKTIEGWLNKRNDLTEQEKKAFWEYIENEEPMKQLAMGRWFANGAIRLPEDQLTVDEAIKDAKKMKVDPASYASHMEIINEYRERFGKQKEEQLLSPDDARFEGILTNKVEHEHGIVVYDVRDDEAGQRAVRELMNNHLGKDFNCWCLLYADGTGEVSKSAKDYWGVYSSAKKRVAFKDGRIVSFCASSYASTEWWDLNDISHGEVIPIEDRVEDDSLGRKSMYEYNESTRESHRIGRLYRGNKKNGVYEEWYDLDPHSLAHRSYHKGGKNIRTSQSWHPNGQLKSKHTYDKEGKIDGEVVMYYSDGQLEERHEYAHGKREGKSEHWYQDGTMSSMAYYKDGKTHGLSAEFYMSGLIKDVSMIDNSEIEWSRKYHVNGTLIEVSYKGKDFSSLETWDKDGTIAYRAKSSDSQKSMIFFKDGYVTRRAVLHKYNDSSLDIYWNGAELEGVALKKGDTVLLSLENPTPAQIEELKDIAREKCPNMLFEIERYVKSQSKPYDFFDQYGWDFGDKSIIGKVDATNEELTSVDQVRFSVVTDKKKIEELEASEKMKGYRTVILNEDGTFSSPMATGLGNKGKTSAKTSGFILGKWEQAEERPELADESGKINLKPKDGGDTYVDYNPYIHNRLNMINTQFTSAWRKPFLVYIETEIPMSDIESGYHAEKAALSVGVHPWNGGDLVLSRYDKPVRIVPWDEVADAWAEQFDEVTFDIVNPELLPLLHERGVKILPPKKAAKEKALAAYEQWKAENSKPRFSVSNIAEDAWNKYQYDGELESIRDVANYIEENMPKNEQTQALFDAIDAYNEEEFEDRQYYGMRGDLEPFEDAILEELETLMNSNPRFSITAEEDKAYADAVARGDMETAQRMVIEAAKKAMPNTKIVDADGNPMIVYHDTNATELVNIETGENWNDLDWRAKDEWRNREDFDEYWEERDFYTFNNLRSRRSIEMPAYFFSTKEDEYHEYGDRTIRAFLNITNPAIDPTIENAGTYDYAGEDAMNRLIAQGHDGFIRTTDNGEWDEVNAFFPNQIKSAEPVTYDDNGNVIPLSERFNDDKKDIRFSLSNTNQRIFVSNAERAVESIKQDKATPQQWKAMIEKQGGLKAGEDKWLGLSEWLDSKVAPAQDNETIMDAARRVAKNTITKQEILDYIAEHQIQIEEVEYAEAESSERLAKLDEYREEFAQLMAEAEEMEMSLYKVDDAQWAFDQMVERYGEDFSIAFEYDENYELQPIEDMYGNYSAADYFLGEGSKTINETRLQYTTKGLENKREIALVVPTIESWNEGDNIHFGDAGNGRAIAWIRFGETEVQTPREVIDHVDELQFAYTNANGQDVYAPQGSKFSKDYAVYGKLANGEMGYVLYVRNNQLSAHPTLEAALEALNAHYEANPRQVTDYGKVLVIDEIQSKRHQEGREKGYATKKDRDIKKKIAKLTDQQDAIFDAMRAREEGRAGITNFTEEETAELKRLGEEIKQLQSELSANNGIIPDAPFDKNWHELAFKRMLRYAAENGYDYVAWTTGEQQAERYDLGKQFDYIEREDNPSINGRRFALNGANYFTFVVNEEGIVTESDMSEIQGKPLADVVGKDLAVRMMSLEDGDAIEGADLRIGGEGMKGFYDKMLPSFVSKYTKKWGAKVQDINLPNLEESAQTMHAVNVTQEMKDSVMDGQVMFSVRNTAEDLRMSPESSIFAEQYDDVPYISFDEDLDTIDSNTQSLFEERFNDVMIDIEMQGANLDEALLYQKAGVVADYIEDINKEKYPVAVVPSNKDVYEWMINKGVSEELARDAQNKLNEKGGDRIRGFHQDGTIFILSQNLDSLSLAKLTYAHEIQHAKNKRNANLIIKVLDAVSRKEALDFISKFGNRGVYAGLLNKKEKGYYTLADEVVAYAMSEGYKLGVDGNLAQYLRDKGITNEELINTLNEEYERQKNDASDSRRFFGQRDIESYRRSVARRTQQDGGDLQARSQEMGESAELETLSRGTQGDRGRIARELAEKAKDSLLRIGAKRLARKYELATTPVEHTPMFSVTGAPTPTPTETKGEYLKRYMAWRESQIEQTARREFVQEMKKADGFFAKAAKKIVDRNKPIDDFQKAVVAQGGKLNVGNNAYADTTMAIGRAGYQVRRFAEHQLENMLDAIREMMDSKLLDNIVLTWDNMDSEYTDPKNLINGKRLTVRELIGVYCQAMDVKEAKEKDLPDRGEAGFKKNLRDANGNEVTYEEVIRMVHDAVAGTNLTKKLWTAINQATKFSLRYQLAAGMIDQETFDRYNRDYYVPERGWRERDLDGREEKYNESQGMTNGSPYNAALQKAKGRDSLASDPFAYIQSIAETSILSAEKNKVKQKFLQFVLDNEAIGRKTGAWNIRKVWLVEGANGQPEVSFEKPADESKIIKGYATESQIKLASEVRQRTRAERLQHQVIVMKDGVQYIVELESEELANTLNGKYEGMNDLWEGWGNVQRTMVNYMSAINTQYNPVFPVFNFVRDFQLALISNIGEQDAKFTARFMKNIGKVQGAIWKYVANEKIMGREAFLATTMGKYLEEYFEQGAQTGFSFLRDIEALNKDIDKALTEGEFKRGAKKTKDVVLGALSMMTEASELTVRLAQYVTARESGYSAEEAAQMAKEISVNFDRKGTESRALSKLYSFFNASIQGTNKIWRMVKSKRARRTLLGASALYMALGILNTLLKPDDPEEDVWASDYTRKTNFLIGKYRIPVAHFFRIFFGAGVEIVLAAQGRKTVKQAIFDTANFTANELIPSSLFQVHNLWEYNEVMNEVEFNPAQYVQGAAPSWISPLTDVAMNRNFMGGKINKEPYTTTEGGKYKRGKYAMKNTDKPWIAIADLLSGGDSRAVRDFGEGQGVSGSTLQHIFEGYVGQAGKFILDAGALPIKAAKGEEITIKDIPFVNRLIVPYKQESAYNQEYWTLKKDLEHYEFLLNKWYKEEPEKYWEEVASEQYDAYWQVKYLVGNKPKEGDTHTLEDVRKLMEANKLWRKVKQQ